MDTILEYCQWILLIISGLLSIGCYIFLTTLMQQIDSLEDRLNRLMAGQDERPEAENIRRWRTKGIKPSLKDKPL